MSYKPVSSSLADLSSIIDAKTETEDESYYDEKYKWVPSQKKWYNPFSWFNEGAHWEGKTIEKFVDYVDMNEVAADYIVPFQKSLDSTKNDAINHVHSETQRLKDYLKGELEKIDKVLEQKLDALSKTKADNIAKTEEIAKKENNLQWLESIQRKINSIINF